MDYRVDIDTANKAKSELSGIIDGKDDRVLNRVGAFASLFALDVSQYKQPILVLKTEEPGSKQLLAFQNDRVESVCFDMINHLINDCIVMGATPLAVQDLIVCGKIDAALVKRVVSACRQACSEQDCALTGGETTEQPDVVPPGTYILGSSIVGIAEKSQIIDGSLIQLGDVVLGIASSGLHTNGYTLVRDLLNKNPGLGETPLGDSTFLEQALVPHRCYYQSLKGLFDHERNHGMAHITGGGIRENLDRVLPKNLDALVNLDAYQVPELFKVVQREAQSSDAVMLRTFNMGIGLCLVSPPDFVESNLEHLRRHGETAYPIGVIVSGKGEVRCEGRFQ